MKPLVWHLLVVKKRKRNFFLFLASYFKPIKMITWWFTCQLWNKCNLKQKNKQTQDWPPLLFLPKGYCSGPCWNLISSDLARMDPGGCGLTSYCAAKCSSVQNPGRDLHCCKIQHMFCSMLKSVGKIYVAALATSFCRQLSALVWPSVCRSWG